MNFQRLCKHDFIAAFDLRGNWLYLGIQREVIRNNLFIASRDYDDLNNYEDLSNYKALEQTFFQVAVKLESVKARHPQLLYESKLYKILQVPFYLIFKFILIYAELYVGDDVDVDFGFGLSSVDIY